MISYSFILFLTNSKGNFAQFQLLLQCYNTSRKLFLGRSEWQHRFAVRTSRPASKLISLLDNNDLQLFQYGANYHKLE